MATDERVLNFPQVASCPSDYLMPDDAEYEIKTVTATYDGSGTASSYLPALQIIDDAGITLATFVDPSSPVTAGASAEVTWGPF